MLFVVDSYTLSQCIVVVNNYFKIFFDNIYCITVLF
nr:MAG TPA: hypothetical protein [Caudoviricetes sp.]